jgi:SAM-dependent methyltransferase
LTTGAVEYRIFQRSYDTFAPRYDEVFEAQQTPKVLGLLAAAGSLPPGLRLDVGAGTGLFNRLSGWDCVEIDVSATMLRTPRRPRCVQADLARLPFANGAAGVIVSVTSLIDFEPSVPAVAEWARVLRPGGALLLSVLKRENLRALELALEGVGFATHATPDLGPDAGYVCRRTG